MPPVLLRQEGQGLNRSRTFGEIPEEVSGNQLRPEDRRLNSLFAQFKRGLQCSHFYYVIMEVRLLAHTPEPDVIVAASARICYSDVTSGELLQGEEENLSGKLIASLFTSGHLSTFEHVSFTFGIDGLSRIASHQLVRHRVASFSQQSQRYVKMSDDVIIPPSIKANPEALRIFQEQARAAHDTYKLLIEKFNIPKEDARFILPHGHATNLVMTMNARELHHFFRLRLCKRAQWEIHELARKMLVLVREKAPVLFAKAGPGCIFGKCEEARSCRQPYKDMEELLTCSKN